MLLHQVQQEYQQQLAVLHANVEEVQQAQQALAATSRPGDRPSDTDTDTACRLEGLEQEIDQLREVTHRLERYVEQMLRQMLGTLNSGQQKVTHLSQRSSEAQRSGMVGCCTTKHAVGCPGTALCF